ncbi:MAG TPA: zinc ribbon domain-containing protein [Chloroflexia bacterium]|nr:zinc ribbon domain-containing protein [Chloroflexia bacterium]
MQHNNPEEQALSCPRCGAEYFAYASFCTVCGKSFGEEGFGDQDEGLADREALSGRKVVRSRLVGLQVRWETWLGLLILTVLMGYVVYDWQVSTTKSDAYRAGLAAMEKRDWDAAVQSFGRAEGYRDAGPREEEAKEKVAHRDRFYYGAVRAAERHDWGAAISALERMREVQPSYRDSDSRMAQARDSALQEGLAGIVYLVSDGREPGLYLRDGQGRSTRLPGSDKYSVVRAISAEGDAIVYDRPSEETDYPGEASRPPNSVALDPFGTDRPARVPVLARMDEGSSVITTLPLPQLDYGGTGVFAEKGLWWYSPQRSTYSFDYEVFYWSQYLPVGSEVMRVSDLAAGRRAITVDPPRSRVVLAEATGDPRGVGRQTRLYLADEMGRDLRLLHSVQGEVYQASWSGDGRWLLYIAQQYGTNSITRTAWVVEPDKSLSAGEEQSPARALKILSWRGIQMDARLSASFIPTSEGPARVVVDHVEYGVEHVLAHNLEDGTIEVLWRESSNGAYRRDLSAFSHDGKYLASRWNPGDGSIIMALDISMGWRTWHSRPFPATDSQIVKIQFAPLDDYMIVSVQNPEGINRGHTQNVYSIQKPERGDGAEARLIAVANMPYDSDAPSIALPGNGSMLAYVNADQELRAVFYNGKGDTLVADNVKAVWSLTGKRGLSWWR